MSWMAFKTSILGGVALAALPPGPGPFGNQLLQQPVPGAERATSPDGWSHGRLCNVSLSPYKAANGSNATDALQRAIDECGDLPEGGTVLIMRGMTLLTASLWLRSNLTLRVETGATLKHTGVLEDAPLTYTRWQDEMHWAHAGLLNAGWCKALKDPRVGWDDCAEWQKLRNIAIEGGGTLDGNGAWWFTKPGMKTYRPAMLNLMWVDGLTVRDLYITRPGFWTIHPVFCNNVRITGNEVRTDGHNTDGLDPDSTWNVYVANNIFDNGDDCVAIKAGRDWSGRMVNISTQNLLFERNAFSRGHTAVAIGSETSGWVRLVTVRDSTMNGTLCAVKLKSARLRGGGAEAVVYQNITGTVVDAISISLQYQEGPVTNVSATPVFRDIVVKDLELKAKGKRVSCEGIPESHIDRVRFSHVVVNGTTTKKCEYCNIESDDPRLECKIPPVGSSLGTGIIFA